MQDDGSIRSGSARLPALHGSPRRSRDLLGPLCLLIGVIGIALVLVGAATRAPWSVSRVWLHSPALLLIVSVLLMLTGAWRTWREGHPRTSWTPSVSGRRYLSALLYTRDNCGLCEEAAALLAQYQQWLPPLVEIDIDADPELRQRFDTCVPVVEIDGKVRFRGRVNEVLLRRLIESTPPADPRPYSSVDSRTAN